VTFSAHGYTVTTKVIELPIMTCLKHAHPDADGSVVTIACKTNKTYSLSTSTTFILRMIMLKVFVGTLIRPHQQRRPLHLRKRTMQPNG